MVPAELEKAKLLRQRSRAIALRTSGNVLRARAATIRALYVTQTARAVLYENRLIRGLKR